RWSPFARLFLSIALIFAAVLPTTGATAQTPSPSDLAHQISKAEIDLRGADRALDGRISPADLKALREKITDAQQNAQTAADRLNEQLVLVNARIAQLGPT
ncbi:hypothetical protein ACTGY7_11030, partial [Streptococcus suis]